MDPAEILAKLATPEECDQFSINVAVTFPDISVNAKRRAVELRATLKGATTEIEMESLRAIFAYEAALTKRRGKITHASRTWQMVKRYGIIGAVERAVNRPNATAGFKILESVGMRDFSFEHVVLRHPENFTAAAVAKSKARLTDEE